MYKIIEIFNIKSVTQSFTIDRDADKKIDHFDNSNVWRSTLSIGPGLRLHQFLQILLEMMRITWNQIYRTILADEVLFAQLLFPAKPKFVFAEIVHREITIE